MNGIENIEHGPCHEVDMIGIGHEAVALDFCPGLEDGIAEQINVKWIVPSSRRRDFSGSRAA